MKAVISSLRKVKVKKYGKDIGKMHIVIYIDAQH